MFGPIWYYTVLIEYRKLLFDYQHFQIQLRLKLDGKNFVIAIINMYYITKFVFVILNVRACSGNFYMHAHPTHRHPHLGGYFWDARRNWRCVMLRNPFGNYFTGHLKLDVVHIVNWTPVFRSALRRWFGLLRPQSASAHRNWTRFFFLIELVPLYFWRLGGNMRHTQTDNMCGKWECFCACSL